MKLTRITDVIAFAITISGVGPGGMERTTVTATLGETSIDLTIDSSYGTFGHFWCSTGDDPIGFLEQLDRDYALKKLTDYDHTELDGAATIAALKQIVIESACGGFEDLMIAELSAICVVDLERNFEATMLEVAPEATRWMQRSDNEWPTRYRTKPQLVAFWKHVWPYVPQGIRFFRDHPEAASHEEPTR